MKKVFHDTKNLRTIENFSGTKECPKGFKEYKLNDSQGYTIDDEGKLTLVNLVKVREDQAKQAEKKRLIGEELEKMAEERLKERGVIN